VVDWEKGTKKRARGKEEAMSGRKSRREGDASSVAARLKERTYT